MPTPQQQADELLAEHQTNRGRKMMTLFDWDIQVKPRLDFIEAGASMAARNAKALPFRPDFTTKAQDELAKARKVLEEALQNIIAAQSIYENKSLESERAA